MGGDMNGLGTLIKSVSPTLSNLAKPLLTTSFARKKFGEASTNNFFGKTELKGEIGSPCLTPSLTKKRR